MKKITNSEIAEVIDALGEMKNKLLSENENIVRYENRVKLGKYKLVLYGGLTAALGVGTLTLASTSLFVPMIATTIVPTLLSIKQIKSNYECNKEYQDALTKQSTNKHLVENLIKNINANDAIYYHRHNYELSKDDVININCCLEKDKRYFEDIQEINAKYKEIFSDLVDEVGYQKKIGVR